MYTKNICDQLIEGILDGDTVKDLLQLKDLTLDKAIQVCQAQEAAKKQRSKMIGIHQESVAAIRNPQTQARNHLVTLHIVTQEPAQAVVANYTWVVEHDAQHSTSPVTFVANWATLLRHVAADICYQTLNLHQQHLQMSFQPTQTHSFQTLAMLLQLTLLPRSPLTLLHRMAQHVSQSYQTQVQISLQLEKEYFIT